jgi:D-alanine-D-alanine ligase
MKIVLLHSADALEPPVDPVLEQVTAALHAAEHEVIAMVAGPDVTPLVEGLKRHAPELVFNLAESFNGKSALESNVAALLNLIDLRYTGSSPAGLMVAGDKTLTKKVLRFHEIRTPEFATIYRGSLDWADDLHFPVIVKPPQEDASIGITADSIVHELRELFGRIDALQSEYQAPVLVEEFIDGREFYVPVLGNANATALPIIELDYSGFPPDRPRIASWQAKWGDDGDERGAEFEGTKSVIATGLPEDLTERMQRIAVEAFHALRLRDYARVDMRLGADGDVYVLEVNPNCYLERGAEFARSAAEAGIAYNALIARIVELAAGRYSR